MNAYRFAFVISFCLFSGAIWADIRCTFSSPELGVGPQQWKLSSLAIEQNTVAGCDCEPESTTSLRLTFVNPARDSGHQDSFNAIIRARIEDGPQGVVAEAVQHSLQDRVMSERLELTPTGFELHSSSRTKRGRLMASSRLVCQVNSENWNVRDLVQRLEAHSGSSDAKIRVFRYGLP